MRWLTAMLERNGSTFTNLTSTNSLYFWSGKRPPTTALVTHTWGLMPLAQQMELIRTLKRDPDPWIVDRPAYVPDQDRATSPFLTFVEQEFVPIVSLGGFTLRAR